MRYLSVLILLLCLPIAAPGADYRGECTVTFLGSSTLHDFNGKGRCQPFTVREAGGVFDMSRLSVAVAGLDTDNAKRDVKMREMFEEKEYPIITGSTAPVTLKELRDRKDQKVTFNLKIRDISKPVSATLANLVETDSRITADLLFTLSLADYKLQPPSVLGVIRVSDKITVKTSVVLNAAK